MNDEEGNNNLLQKEMINRVRTGIQVSIACISLPIIFKCVHIHGDSSQTVYARFQRIKNMYSV